MQSETKIITILNQVSPKFVQGRIMEMNETFVLSKRIGDTEDEITNAVWTTVGTFSLLKDAIVRSTKDDFFNSDYDAVNKLWPKFPNECQSMWL